MKSKESIPVLNSTELKEFQGIVLTKSPCVLLKVDVLKNTTNGSKYIGSMSTLDLYGGNDIVRKVKKSFPRVKMSGLAISDNLSFIFDV